MAAISNRLEAEGSKNKSVLFLDTLGDEAAPEIVKAIIARAKDSDAIAAKPILDSVWPMRKGARVEFDLGSIKQEKELPAAISGITGQVRQEISRQTRVP